MLTGKQPVQRLVSKQIQNLTSALQHRCESFQAVSAAYVYGSVLREDFVMDRSDIDLLLIVERFTETLLRDFIHPLADGVPNELDVTVITQLELAARVHPGWSRHYFFNVRNSGICVYGPDLLHGFSEDELSFEEAFRRLVQMTQRIRFVVINKGKRQEAPFWLSKYQYWIPLCLMEFLALHGTPEYRMRMAHDIFVARFPDLPVRTRYPYSCLVDLQIFLEHLTIWIKANQDLFLPGTIGCAASRPSTG
jgi:predicted nucleotidyltransferase